MPTSAILSDLLGYTSITCFLCAQLPQILKNKRRQSCDGLSWPFLANWFLGDSSNLIGCILTHQLPFQRYLATYSIFIDSVLIAQFIYYSDRTPPLPSALSPTLSYYRTFSEAAANVATAAALAAPQDNETVHHRRHETELVLRPDDSGNLVPHITLTHDEVGMDLDEGGTADSSHSEDGRDTWAKHVPWGIEPRQRRATYMGRLSAIVPSFTPSVIQVAGFRRGSSLGRGSETLAGEDHIGEVTAGALPAASTVANRGNSRAGKKSATMVFLGAWALFGIRTLMGNRHGLSMSSSVSTGKVLSPLNPSFNIRVPVTVTTVLIETLPLPPNLTLETPSIFEDQNPPSHEPYPANPSAERILGRVFAWLCTTLYLTSRLPQIWKNFVRKSTEGLSMYLFVFAFLGNTFYVASILFSPYMYLPPPASTAFLKESIPYLLGSGGTLMFDLTIVLQSFIYRQKHKKQCTRGRGDITNLEVGVDAEEECAGLLTGDTLTYC